MTEATENNTASDSGVPADQRALAQLFEQHRERLEQMVRLRMDRRLQGRLDPADVLQEAFLECSQRLDDYRANPELSPFVWLRFLTAQKLVDFHRMHLGAKMRDAGQEVSLYRGSLPFASSASLAAQLLGRLTSASRAAIRAETQIRVQEALNAMEPLDREVIALRHFEMLSNDEAAQVLGIKKTASSNRYLRAMKRLRQIMIKVPGLRDL